MTGDGVEPLLERSGELEAISEVVAAARACAGGCLLVRGPAGIGKSRLLEQARVEGGRDRMTVLVARGAVLEREYPFGVVLQLVGRLAADESRRDVMLAGAAGAARTVFEPDHLVTSGPDATFAVLHGLFWAIANLSTAGPVLVCVDDLQWADELSLRFLDFLARRANDLPLALVFAVRAGEGTKVGVGGVLGELVGGPLIRTVAPAALSEAAVLDLTRARFGARASEAFAKACWSATGGNPLYLAELQRELNGENVEATSEAARSVAAAAPRALGPLILGRLGRLGERAVRLAGALAVFGDRVLLPDAAELAGLSREEASEAAHALFGAGVVGAGRELTFTHPLLRDVLYVDVPEVLRGEYHARAARILDERGRRPESVVAQLLLATAAGDGWVVERLRGAARRAINQGAPAAAVAPLHRALSEPPADSVRPVVLLELGEAEAASGGLAALEHLSAARELLSPGALRASAALALSRLLTIAGQRARACEIAVSARAELGVGDRELALMLAAAALGAAVNSPGIQDLAEGLIEELASLEGATPAECAVLANLGLRKLSAAEPKTSIAAIVERAIAGGGCAFSTAPDGFSPLIIVSMLTSLDAVERAAELGADLIEEARGAGSPFWFAAACAFRAPALLFSGAVREAESDARLALEAAASRFPLTDRLAAAALARALIARGDIAAAERELDSVSPDEETVRQPGGAMLQYARAQLEGARGRYDQQLARLTVAGEVFESAGAVNPAVTLWRPDAAVALAQLGRREEAQAVLAPALDAAHRFGGAFALGTCLRAAALIEEPASVELLRAGRETLQSSELRLELARILIDLGAALRRLGHRREAREPLREGMHLAHLCGTTPLVERARTELLAAGARPRRALRSGLDALTPAELRVAQLAADGMGNLQIAQSLFVTRKTIETQMAAVLRKLD